MVLQHLSHGSIITNCAVIYFTSQTYRDLFVYNNDEYISVLTVPWDLLKFFMIVVAIEHCLLFVKLYLEEIIDDNPKWIVRGVKDT